MNATRTISFNLVNFVNSIDSQNSIDNNNDNYWWNFLKVDFFDSMYDDKFVVIDNFIKHVNKNIYF